MAVCLNNEEGALLTYVGCFEGGVYPFPECIRPYLVPALFRHVRKQL